MSFVNILFSWYGMGEEEVENVFFWGSFSWKIKISLYDDDALIWEMMMKVSKAFV